MGSIYKKSKRTATQYRRQHRQDIWRVVLRIVAILGLVLCGINDIGNALSWIGRASAGDTWPPGFVHYGQMMILGVGLMAVALVLTFFVRRRTYGNWIAVGLATVGIVLCLVATCTVAGYAEESGYYSRMWEMPASQKYYTSLLPTLIPYGAIAGLGILQFCSEEGRQQRRENRRKKDEKAPSIL